MSLSLYDSCSWSIGIYELIKMEYTFYIILLFYCLFEPIIGKSWIWALLNYLDDNSCHVCLYMFLLGDDLTVPSAFHGQLVLLVMLRPVNQASSKCDRWYFSILVMVDVTIAKWPFNQHQLISGGAHLAGYTFQCFSYFSCIFNHFHAHVLTRNASCWGLLCFCPVATDTATFTVSFRLGAACFPGHRFSCPSGRADDAECLRHPLRCNLFEDRWSC